MLSFPDWPVDLHLGPSRLFASFLVFVLLSSFAVIFAINLPNYITLPFLLIQVGLVISCLRRFAINTHPLSIRRISFKGSVWILENNLGQQNEASLQSCFLSPFLMVLHLQDLTGQEGSFVATLKSRVLTHQLIFIDQIAEDDFRKLFVFLKFGKGKSVLEDKGELAWLARIKNRVFSLFQ